MEIRMKIEKCGFEHGILSDDFNKRGSKSSYSGKTRFNSKFQLQFVMGKKLFQLLFINDSDLN